MHWRIEVLPLFQKMKQALNEECQVFFFSENNIAKCATCILQQQALEQALDRAEVRPD